MICVMLNRPEFQYEVHSLVRAFFPGQEVRVCCNIPETDSVRSRRRARAAEKAEPETPLFVLDISFAPRGGSGEDSLLKGCEEEQEEKICDAAADGKAGEKICDAAADGGAEETASGSGAGADDIFSDEAPEKEAAEAGAQRPEKKTAETGLPGQEKEAAGFGLPGQGKEAAEAEPSEKENVSGEAMTDFTLTLTAADGTALHVKDSGEPDPGETKNELKRAIYRLLSSYTGKTLPWGSLTGIRPTKIARKLIDQGWKNGAIADYMRNTYLTGNEKTALAVSIANREHYLLQKLAPACRKPQNAGAAGEGAETVPGGSKESAKADPELFASGYSLYVGIPFCPSICLYCSFSSSPLSVWKNRVEAYLDTLCHEIESVSKLVPYRRPDTVYIGGGTPTTLEPAQLNRLLTKLEDCFDLDGVLEFTVEAGRPDSITREKLQTLKDHGVSRISINPQTMNQGTLDFIGRRHTVSQTVEAFHLAREMGFDNINMDLIVGLPGEGKAEVEYTMQELSKLDPDSITVHSLAVKRAARLRLFREEHKELTMENSSEIMNMTAAYAQRAGLYPYYLYRQKNMAGNFENVGYAREGREGLYNILIMEEIQTILALGAGAASKLVRPGNRIERVANVKDIKGYMERIDEMIERKRSALYDGNHTDL